MRATLAFALSTLFTAAYGQGAGSATAETHPTIQVGSCTKSGGCSTSSKPIVLDSNWRWTHTASGYTNCYSGSSWDTSLCPDGKTCATNCVLDGADYSGTYGITASGSSLSLKFITGTNAGSRVYLMESDTKYQMLKLLNKEFTFDVDVSTLPCGFNGALYFVSMDADGGMSRFSGNKAGAKYGTGYCDAQCPHDIKFINGEANVKDFKDGLGGYGTCCPEMDIWEANSISTAYTPHPCSVNTQTRCEGADCGDGDRYAALCDKDGCDFNSYRMGVKNFYGPGSSFTIDTTKPFTVVTQFITQGNSDTGDLIEIKRFYVQNGKTVANSMSAFDGLSGGPYDSVTDKMCSAQKTFFEDRNEYANKGGLKAMGKNIADGMVLVLSIWDDTSVAMLWLDSVAFPTDADPSKPGIARGSCATTSGKPEELRSKYPNATVKFSNIKWGEIGSTFNALTSTTTTRTGTTTTTSSRTTTTTSRTTTTSPTTTRTTSTAVGTCVANTTTVTVQGAATTVYQTVTVTQGGQQTTTTTRPTTTTTTTSGGSTNCAAKYAQCGGTGFSGPTCCASGSTCTTSNQWYSQCL